MPREVSPAHVMADTYNRITIPKGLSECVSWLEGVNRLHAWLLLLEPGRYRLLSDEQVLNDPKIEPVRTLNLEGKSVELLAPTFAEELSTAAIVARVVPTIVAPPPPGWRLTFPRTFELFVPNGCNPKAFSILLSLEGYLEFWYSDVLRNVIGSSQPKLNN